MDTLRAALQRLERAVGRLEHAAVGQTGRAVARTRELGDQVREARTAEALAVANAEEMSRRLESAIGRLEAVLES
ncbi:hypothetical protein HL658_22495 [Azospirillum sp. RWY-5-1]|uniref:DUF4164 domain-containing protein n=1 Tax=Azospirillum oleiclasticum TaxID=2735135 RepID=A0ABX2TEZ2_9PROT|nr:hypothetical protein [Azospirillum oleiclasticum]NYZ15319.1 hypothetical protein [Azospirillum oleiclasticum]NYZ21260.1 hypothetical protein [Azospirillum oleiclasticum]